MFYKTIAEFQNFQIYTGILLQGQKYACQSSLVDYCRPSTDGVSS